MNNLNLIACISRDRGLGKDGQLLWQIPEDMRFFKQITLDGIVVMGRKTFDSIGRPLPKRDNIMLSSRSVNVDGVHQYSNLDELNLFLQEQSKPVFIIGGASLYNIYINRAEKLYLTEVAASKPADTFFPEFDKSQFDRKVLQTGSQDGVKYDIVEYARK